MGTARLLYAHARIHEITDISLLCLIDEVYLLRGTPKEGMVVHFLRQSMLLSGKWMPFDKREFRIPEYVTREKLLVRKLDTFALSAIYELCLDLLAMPRRIQNEPIEDHCSATLYVFLNRVLKEQPKKKRQPLI